MAVTNIRRRVEQTLQRCVKTHIVPMCPRPDVHALGLDIQYLHRYRVVHVKWCMCSCLNQMWVPPIPSSWLTPAQIMESDSQLVPANLSLGRGLQSLLDCLVYVLLCVCVFVCVCDCLAHMYCCFLRESLPGRGVYHRRRGRVEDYLCSLCHSVCVCICDCLMSSRT